MLNDMTMAPPGSGDNTTKIETILRLFVNGKSLNRFEAEAHHDHCLHTSVSTLQGYSVAIARHWESVPCLNGRARVRCKRYWLDPAPENIARARNLLERWERK
jgi:hypothetical protein